MKDFNPETIKLPPELENRLFFTPNEFGALVKASIASLHRWRRAGWLKMTQFTPRCYMVPRSELERYSRGEMMSTAEPRQNNT